MNKFFINIFLFSFIMMMQLFGNNQITKNIKENLSFQVELREFSKDFLEKTIFVGTGGPEGRSATKSYNCALYSCSRHASQGDHLTL